MGESLFGVLLAGLIVSTGRPEPLGLVGDAFAKASTAIGAVAFVVVSAPSSGGGNSQPKLCIVEMQTCHAGRIDRVRPI